MLWCNGVIMKFKEVIERIGRERINYWVFLTSIALAFDGLFQFIFFWVKMNWLKSTIYWTIEGSGYAYVNSFLNYLIWFTQIYFCLFIPLIVYLGFKYRNSFNGKKIKIFSVFILSFLFVFFEIKFAIPVFSEWIFLFIIIYTIMILKFSVVFSLSFSILCFQVANMLWEMAEINLNFGTILSYILIYSIFIFVLYKLKIKIDLYIYLSVIPMLFSWIYFYPLWRAWSTYKTINFISEINTFSPYFRLFVFPFIITITLKIYFTHRKYGKTLNSYTCNLELRKMKN
jgi:hypothetical protein